jgi:outer membrane protein
VLLSLPILNDDDITEAVEPAMSRCPGNGTLEPEYRRSIGAGAVKQPAIGLIIAITVLSGTAVAQPQAPPPPATGPLTLERAVREAVQRYPVVQEQRARTRAAAEGIAVARTAYLPRVDVLWQENRATHNNVFGLLLPQAVIPPLSGPVLPRSSDSVWGSAAGALLSWDAIDFGQRKSSVRAARAQQEAAAARTAATELEIGAAAADAFLTVLAADAGVRAAQANVERLGVFANAVGTLVTNQLRPGVDQSRAQAELALARNQLIQAQQAAEIARASLAESIGQSGTVVEVTPGRLGDIPVTIGAATGVDAHPATRAAQAAIDVVRAREQVLAHAALPRVALQSAVSTRGSGALLAGIDDSNGLWPRVPNWAAGVTVTFPLMDTFSVRPRQRVEAENEVAERARYDQTVATLTTQQVRAAALYKAAAAIAANMSAVRQAAVETEQRARARYENGLANITEVAEAQRLLAQVETDDAVARLSVWRALLAQAQTAGDLTGFLRQAGTP